MSFIKAACYPAGTNSTNNTKPACPLVNGTAVPAIRPVAVPEITSLQGGQILVGVNNTVPTQIKVRLPGALDF